MKRLSVTEPFTIRLAVECSSRMPTLFCDVASPRRTLWLHVRDEHTDIEFPDRATRDGDAAVAGPVVDAVVAARVSGAAVVLVVAVNGVAVEVELDVVGPDHEPVADTVGEVVVQGRIPGDRVTATPTVLATAGAPPSDRTHAATVATIQQRTVGDGDVGHGGDARRIEPCPHQG